VRLFIAETKYLNKHCKGRKVYWFMESEVLFHHGREVMVVQFTSWKTGKGEGEEGKDREGEKKGRGQHRTRGFSPFPSVLHLGTQHPQYDAHNSADLLPLGNFLWKCLQGHT
jgi:hypothetical protein